MTVFSRTHLTAALALGAAALVAAPALAQQTDTDTLSLNVVVQNSCSITGTTINFGTYTSNQPDHLDAEGTLDYQDCPADATVTLSGGGFGNVNDRRLMNGSNTLRYELFQDSARSDAWAANAVTVPAAGSGSMIVYARINNQQAVQAGSYADSVQITITF